MAHGMGNNSDKEANRRSTQCDDKVIRCYLCNQKGHLAFPCPQRTSLYCDRAPSDTEADTMGKQNSSQRLGKFNYRPCQILSIQTK